ncbi:hypothetical protein S101446_01982 [Komagataeibacter europaeus]|nr:hypothetical protein S101446_01982 [Komagataeibacter europaeus]
MMVTTAVMTTVMLCLLGASFRRSGTFRCVRGMFGCGNGRGGRLGSLGHDGSGHAHDGNSGQGGNEATGENDHIKILQQIRNSDPNACSGRRIGTPGLASLL